MGRRGPLIPDPAKDTKGQPGIASAALFGLCPACGSKALFAGLAKFAPACRICRLDFSKFNVGDGPAAFLTLIIGALVVALALTVELKWQPPFWVHVVLWVPFTSAAVIGGLRAAKAALLAVEYQRNAGEGKLKD
jgi:uncharacterized protein (DUF983 family)